MSDFHIGYHVFTHPNRPSRQGSNEDAVLAASKVLQGRVARNGVIPRGQPSLFAVSDGLHATPSAARASRTLLEQLNAIWNEDAVMAIGRKVEQLHGLYCETAIGYPAREGMACTLVAAEIHGSQARIYHVGDSRAWLIRDGRASCLTRDHTALEWMLRAGEISSADADQYASVYGALDNYFMASPFETPQEHDLCELMLEYGDMLLLASDGISILDDEAISRCIGTDLATMAEGLFDASVSTGSDDNFSIIAIRFIDAAGPSNER